MSDFAIGEQNFREKPDISQVFIRAIDRSNHVAVHGGYGVSESGIKQILATLPVASREWVYDQDDRYMEDTRTLIYKKYCGIRLGENQPLRRNESLPFTYMKDDDGVQTNEIDLDDPNIISPKIKVIPQLKIQKFSELVMEAAEYAGLTWQSELLLLDGGDTEEEIIRKKTPHRMSDEERQRTQTVEDEE